MENKKGFTLRDLVLVGVMAAVVFVVTYLIKIGPIPTPAGPTQLKLGNAFCLLGGILLGKTKGGLAAGIGSMLFDLTNPAFVSDAPITLINFFLMAFVCGAIAWANGAEGKNNKQNILAAVAGALTYLALYFLKNIVLLMLAGSTFYAAAIAISTKMLFSSINAVLAVVVASILAPAFRRGLEGAGIYKKFAH